MNRIKSFRWSWTLNNPTDQEVEAIKNLTPTSTNDSNATGIVYTIIGKETGSQGTFHLQGYTEFSSRMRLPGVKKLLSPRIHAEKSVADWKTNKDYCSKEGNLLLEWGTPKQPPGKRGGEARASQLDERLSTLKEIIDEGGMLEQCWDQDFSAMVRYGRGISEYAILKGRHREPPKVTVITGAAGTGKTRFVYDNARIFYDDDIWSYPGGGWFDGYQGQQVALFDDYRGDLPFDLFLKILDRYPIRVPVKGGFRNWIPKCIFITSNARWDEWYPNAFGEHKKALRRRMSCIHEVNDTIY